MRLHEVANITAIDNLVKRLILIQIIQPIFTFNTKLMHHKTCNHKNLLNRIMKSNSNKMDNSMGI